MRYLQTLIISTLFTLSALGQLPGLVMEKGQRKIDIPFDIENGFITLKVTVENALPLRFVFDTGAENTILTKKEVGDMLRFKYSREFRILGADMKTELIALLARGIKLDLGNIEIKRHNLLVLDNDYFRFDEVAGVPIHGIIGADAFRYHVVKINFQKKIITLYKPEYYSPPKKGYQEIPIEIIKSKPYLPARIKINNQIHQIKLLMDTGAGLSLLLHNNIPNFHPPTNIVLGDIGSGLGGSLEGFIGRIDELNIEHLKLGNVITKFQDLSVVIDTSYLNNRNGLLGIDILNRFNIIINYPSEKLYLQPNKRFNQKFKFDRSGISLIAEGIHLNQFVVSYVLKNSPADLAGVKKNDKLLKINGLSRRFHSLTTIINILQKREGKQIKLLLKRGDQRIKVKFKLKELF